MAKATQSEFEKIIRKLELSDLRGFALRQLAMDMLTELEGYDWSGIYRLEGDSLFLDAFNGAPTDHREIPVGKGVCGTAVAQNANQVIDDVQKLENYLSCSIHTRSEIVVLIRDQGVILGQIDIDGHRVRNFDQEDEAFLERIGEILALRWDDPHAL